VNHMIQLNPAIAIYQESYTPIFLVP